MSKEINRMFSDIHQKYDLMNHLLSFGVDNLWRSRAAKEAVIKANSYEILDIAAGTGEFSIAIYKECSRSAKDVNISGIDFNKDMLKVAKRKAKKLRLDIRFDVGDALSLKFPANNFDVVTSAFALRDFDNLNKFIKEAYRVLKPGGKVILVEMSKPESGLMKHLFNIYFNVMAFEGMLVDKHAYSFLINSIKSFDKNGLLKLLKDNQFKDVKLTNLTSNAAFLVTARK